MINAWMMWRKKFIQEIFSRGINGDNRMAQKGERTVIRILQVVNDIHRAGLETMQISW